MLNRLRDWLAEDDVVGAYRSRVETRTRKLIARYGRRNVAFQDGAIMDRQKHDRLIAAGDAAVARMKARAGV